MSNVYVLHSFGTICKCNKLQTPRKQRDLIRMVNKALSSLILFVMRTESSDALRCEGLQNVERQRLLKDFGVIEIIVDVLYYPFRNGVLVFEELGT